jgi:hypothetical protein
MVGNDGPSAKAGEIEAAAIADKTNPCSETIKSEEVALPCRCINEIPRSPVKN